MEFHLFYLSVPIYTSSGCYFETKGAVARYSFLFDGPPCLWLRYWIPTYYFRLAFSIAPFPLCAEINRV